MNDYYICLLVILYAMLGLGVFSMTKFEGKIKPIDLIGIVLIWPLPLIIFSIVFLFSGCRYSEDA